MTASRDGFVDEWDLLSGSQVIRYAHDTCAHAFRVVDDASVVTADDFDSLLVWNRRAGELASRIQLRQTAFRVANAGPRAMLVGTADGTVHRVDLDRDAMDVGTTIGRLRIEVKRMGWTLSDPERREYGLPAAAEGTVLKTCPDDTGPVRGAEPQPEH
ncbi:MAG: hypothetical protein JNM69_41035 [Archangium sp.]|nr:hypothetical protein [Archangium sp.]